MNNSNDKKKRYKIFVEIQTRKIISAYGGVGSIFESTKGALIIEKFDDWLVKPEEYYRINDERLIQRLRYEKAFARLEYLFQVPIADDSNTIHVSSSYFPEWFFCPNCKRFKKIDEWFKEWKKVQEKYKKTDINEIKESFIPPKCAYCFDNAMVSEKKRKYYELEQVRFIMTSANGYIDDIPWERWTNAIKAGQQSPEEDDNSSRIQLGVEHCCDNQDLRYKQSEKFEDLKGINIICEGCGSRNTLTGLFALRERDESKKADFKPVIRSSNSVYYPILINSIYLPVKEIPQEDKNKISKWVEKNKDVDFIYDALEEKYSKSKIENYINQSSNSQNSYISEMDYRRDEYEFILANQNYSDDNLIFTPQSLTNDYKNWGIESIVKVSRLKMTTVQTGYTRQEPLDIDAFLNEGYQDNKIKPKYTSSKGNQTECLPAIESFGEGIFISFEANYRKWANHEAEQRVKPVLERSQNPENQFFNKKFLNAKHIAKFIYIHSFSHILIKELEFLCGYPAVSLNERLYIDDKNMQGVLIYTIAGSEGSYGGLINQAKPEKLAIIIESALERAKECSSDPICKHAEEQGIGGLNLAACYSCLLLPETSCEELNCFLDRHLLLGE